MNEQPPLECTCGAKDNAHEANCILSRRALADFMGLSTMAPPKLDYVRMNRGRGGGRLRGGGRKDRMAKGTPAKEKPAQAFKTGTLEQKLADGVWLSHNELRKLKRRQQAS